MNLDEINEKYNKMQEIYGAKELDSIHCGGCINNPDICFVFMNPTKRNIASSKSWHGIKYPWIGTKNIWDLFYKINLLDEKIYREIKEIKGPSWEESFANKVYNNVIENSYCITNLGKCTQMDARVLPDKVLKEYLDLLFKEIEIINPKIIITFGNQVSSIVLNEKISVSQVRKKLFKIKINNKEYKVYPVYYPVGNGRFNIDKAIEDINWIIKKEFNIIEVN